MRRWHGRRRAARRTVATGCASLAPWLESPPEAVVAEGSGARYELVAGAEAERRASPDSD